MEVQPKPISLAQPSTKIKRTPKKKTPPKLSIKQNLLLEKLKIFYDHKSNMDQILDIINSTSKISLRIIDWFVTNYSKKHFVVIPIKKVTSSIGDKVTTKTKKKTNLVEKDVNVFLNYKAQLKAYSKKQFDPFCRRERISFKYNDTKSIVTTVGQLNFFRWAIENDILLYINDNIKDIEEDMNLNIKKPPSKKKKSLKKTESTKIPNCTLNTKQSPTINKTLQHPGIRMRKKRRELSTSAVKSLNKHPGNIVLSFD
jgi:hypothetical protein